MPVPILNTERLILRALTMEDTLGIYTLRTNAIVNKYINRPGINKLQDTAKFINRITDSYEKGNHSFWVICLKDSLQLIGTICLWNFSEDRKTAELGYELHPDFHGKGYMDEALKEFVGYAKTIAVNTIEAFTHRENESSKRLLDKNGFILQPDRKDDDNLNNIIYSLNI
jgi:ribosomal-protein-alanine N-acetyltransferase